MKLCLTRAVSCPKRSYAG